MTCATIRERIHELLDQRRSPDSDPLVAEHCRECPSCAEQLQLLQQLEATLRVLPRPEPSRNLPRRIVQQVVASAAEPVAPADAAVSKRRWDGLVLVVVVALGLLVMVAVDSLWQPPDTPGPAVVQQNRSPLTPPAASPPPIKQLQENLQQLMAETQRELQQAQALLPESESRLVQAPPVGAEMFSPMAELVRPLQPVASDTFSTLGTFWSRVTESMPQENASGSQAGPG